ncbi:MAG: AraC family transcriptional regulator [Phycisphaerae bacterium]
MVKAYQPIAAVQPVTDLQHVRVLALDEVIINPLWNFSDVCDGFWRLYMCRDAGAAVETAREQVKMRPGKVYLIPAWVKFSCRCTRPVRHGYVHFDLAGLPGAISREVFDRVLRVEGPDLQILMQMFGDRSGKTAPFRAARSKVWLVKALVYAALEHALALLPEEMRQRLRAETGTSSVAAALRYIEAHQHEAISVGQLAEVCGYSQEHFLRLFRRATGQSPMQYVVERRVAAAGELLLLTAEKIERIAARTGFANRHHFTRVFGQRMGVSPAAYRKAARW